MPSDGTEQGVVTAVVTLLGSGFGLKVLQVIAARRAERKDGADAKSAADVDYAKARMQDEADLRKWLMEQVRQTNDAMVSLQSLVDTLRGELGAERMMRMAALADAEEAKAEAFSLRAALAAEAERRERADAEVARLRSYSGSEGPMVEGGDDS